MTGEQCCTLDISGEDQDRLVTMFKALGNPIRFEIVKYLVTHPGCITGDIVDALPIAQATVSQHLKVLRDTGWISGTVTGTAVSYCLDAGNIAWFRARRRNLLKPKRAAGLFFLPYYIVFLRLTIAKWSRTMNSQLANQLAGQLVAIIQFVVTQFAATWPYLLITIPLAVAVRLSGASRYITRALSTQPLVAIVLATIVGAFSPFCSCSVIPVVASLLIGGVPLAPVMAFWIASPSMDPEIFFLSVGMLGWELAFWRLGSTLVLSLAAGFITYLLMQRGWLGANILRSGSPSRVPLASRTAAVWHGFTGWVGAQFTLAPRPALAAAAIPAAPACGCSAAAIVDFAPTPEVADAAGCSTGCADTCTGSADAGFGRRLLAETGDATLMVMKFMVLAYTLEALITLYVPQAWIISTLGGNQPLVIVWAAALGVPIYTSNLTAMPLISGLVAQGMSPAAALAFLISGPTTTLPAMAAVYGLVTRRVFLLYVGFALFGAIIAGYAYFFAHLLW